VTSPRERARLLDAEMQLQRSWLEMSLRDFSSGHAGVFSGLNPLKIGAGFLKHRSVWLLALSVIARIYRRRAHKVKT
jgi:hypothetical protein